MYLALHRGGWMMQNHLGQFLLENLLNVYDIQESDHSRLLILMEQYCDRPMDLADATLVLAAEKTGYRQILTLDSDFFCFTELVIRTALKSFRSKRLFEKPHLLSRNHNNIVANASNQGCYATICRNPLLFEGIRGFLSYNVPL